MTTLAVHTHDELLLAALADPCDGARRLVLADWIEDHGGDAAPLRRAGYWLLLPPATNSATNRLVCWQAGRDLMALADLPVYRACRCAEKDCRSDFGQMVLGGQWCCGNHNCRWHALARLRREAVQALNPKAVKLCPTCAAWVPELVGDGCCPECVKYGWVKGRRGWRVLGEYDG